MIGRMSRSYRGANPMRRAMIAAAWLNLFSLAVSPSPVDAVGLGAGAVALGLLAVAHQINREAGKS